MEIYSDLNIDEGRFLGETHQVIKVLGEGCYGYVCKCLNTETDEVEAVKINKSKPISFSIIQRELAILKRLRSLDPDECNIVRCYGSFSHGEHLCIRFEVLDQSLKDYMRERHKRGLPMPQLRLVIHQLATALLHLSSVGIIHADVKPDNVMIIDRWQTPPRVKLIDFGVAHSVNAVDIGSFVQAVSYMSPEALVGSPYCEAVDIWSLGLTAAELTIGTFIYPGRTWYEILYFITKTQGHLPGSQLDCGMDTGLFFRQENDGQERWILRTPGELGFKTTGTHPTSPTSHKLKTLDDLQELMCDDHQHQRHQHLLVDLIKRMLHLDQYQRIKVQEVLQHPFFTECLPELSETNILIEMVGTEDTRRSPSDPTSGMENIPSGGTKTVSLAAESEENTGDEQNSDGLLSFMKTIVDLILSWFK